MYIPAFIEDDEIVEKLNEKGIRVVSPVYRIVIPGSTNWNLLQLLTLSSTQLSLLQLLQQKLL
jgi:hypothetical protein